MDSNIGQYGVCWCGKEIDRKLISVRLSVAGRSVTIDSVPTGICEVCNYRYYKASVVELLESTFRGEHAPTDDGLPSNGDSTVDRG